jgi:4-hydroxy-2-oxoheptanedioate aldolase
VLEKNHFHSQLQAGRMPIQAWMWNPSVLHAEVISRTGFDSVGLDLQHGAIDFSDLYGMMAIISANGSTPMVRVPGNDRAWISRVLDGGAYGVICPDVQTGEEAAAFGDACKYAPVGTRGFGPVRPVLGTPGASEMAPSGFTPAGENEAVMAIVQIESPLGLKNAEEILSTPNVDAIFPGFVDYSMLAFGEPIPDSSDSRLREPLERILKIAHGAGKYVGVAASPDNASKLIEAGVDWLVMANDFAWLAAAARQTLAAGREATRGKSIAI